MKERRRRFLAVAGGAGALAVSGLLKPGRADAAVWNKAGFESKALADALRNLGAANAAESRDIAITAP
ncbi:MAG: thiosulfate oxidation carrier protein SoxY, partial [Burkholderiales bacterium]